MLLGLAICATPLSIAVTEILLGGALLLRLAALSRGRGRWHVPRVFWFWLAWAALEIASWLLSPEIRKGWGEIRHLLLIAVLFLVIPALDSVPAIVTVWKGLVISATLGSGVLIALFVVHLFFHPANLDPVVYLRGGGLLHHWMIYAVVEIPVFAGLLQLWRVFREERRWLLPAAVINVAAIVLSLTRTLWVCCLLLLFLHLIWVRSRWVWAVPAIPCVALALAPGVVRTRIIDFAQPNYYANAERIEMLRVGGRMIGDKPLVGVGAGRVDQLYTTYLAAGETVPAYHGHLHNNIVQLAAEFGVPVAVVALAFVGVLFRDLFRGCARAEGREQLFLCRTAVLGLAGFLAAGMFDYTYGHSLGLILLCFTVLAPLASIDTNRSRASSFAAAS